MQDIIKLFHLFSDLVGKLYNIESFVNKAYQEDARKEDVISIREELQEIYNDLTEIQIGVQTRAILLKLDFEELIPFNEEGEGYTCKQVIELSAIRATHIQFKYLYPLNIKLADFYEKESEKRDKKMYEKSRKNSIRYSCYAFIAGILLDLCFPWLYHFYPTLLPPKEYNNVTILQQDSIEDDFKRQQVICITAE